MTPPFGPLSVVPAPAEGFTLVLDRALRCGGPDGAPEAPQACTGHEPLPLGQSAVSRLERELDAAIVAVVLADPRRRRGVTLRSLRDFLA